MSRTKLKTKPQRIGDFPKPYRDALAYWSSLRNLGFEADEIFVGFGPIEGYPDWLHLQLQTQGKEFVVCVTQMPGATRPKVMKTWKRFATLAQSSTEPERAACFKDHLLGQSLDYYMAFVLTIQAKGIVVPLMPEFTTHEGQA